MAVALNANLQAYAGDESDLVAAVRAGDDRAFEVLYQRYRPRIGAYVANMIGDHARAEDIAQDVFIAALRRLRATEQPIMFKPWLYEIAKNACIDEYRKAQRAREIPLDASGADEIGNLPAKGLTPEAAIETKQRLDDLRGAFRGLSETHHQILVLRELEGLSYSQIGERLGLSKPVVESTLFRARRRLGEEFAELESGRRCTRVEGLIAGVSARRIESLGLRERRLLSRHLSHCERCCRRAHQSGLDIASVRGTPGVKRAGLGALLPFPIWWFRFKRSGPAPSSVVPGGAVPGGAHAASALQTIQTVAPAAGPLTSGAGRAVAAAVLAVAGAGGGIFASNSVIGGRNATPISHHIALAPHSGLLRASAATGSVQAPTSGLFSAASLIQPAGASPTLPGVASGSRQIAVQIVGSLPLLTLGQGVLAGLAIAGLQPAALAAPATTSSAPPTLTLPLGLGGVASGSGSAGGTTATALPGATGGDEQPVSPTHAIGVAAGLGAAAGAAATTVTGSTAALPTPPRLPIILGAGTAGQSGSSPAGGTGSSSGSDDQGVAGGGTPGAGSGQHGGLPSPTSVVNPVTSALSGAAGIAGSAGGTVSGAAGAVEGTGSQALGGAIGAGDDSPVGAGTSVLKGATSGLTSTAASGAVTSTLSGVAAGATSTITSATAGVGATGGTTTASSDGGGSAGAASSSSTSSGSGGALSSVTGAATSALAGVTHPLSGAGAVLSSVTGAAGNLTNGLTHSGSSGS